MARVVVVGGGVTGLAAAWQLVSSGPHEVVVLESAAQVGGKLRQDEVGGRLIDVGAESMLARRPEALNLLAELGIQPVHPASSGASLWSRGRLEPLPAGTLMGVPSSPGSALGALTASEVSRLAAEQPVEVEGDISVGDLVERALGAAVVDRLVEPLLGGVYAGHARLLSAEACVPGLFRAAAAREPLTEIAIRARDAAAARSAAPVFAGLDGGVGSLPSLLATAIVQRGGEIRTGVTVREITRTPAGWDVVTGPVPAPVVEHADAVLVATPARPAARLLAEVAPRASRLLGEIEYASMAIVSFAFDRAELASVPTGSGFLVPPVDGRTIKAATFSSGKWPWLAERVGDLFFLRVSLGRHREEAVLQRDDGDLATLGLADLELALGGVLPRPVDTHIQRWGGGLPQYAVGHVGRVSEVMDAVAEVDGLEVAGAAYDGVGIPACIGSGRAAAERTLTHLAERDQRLGKMDA